MIFPTKNKDSLYFIQLGDGTKVLATMKPANNKEFKTLVNPLRVENIRLSDGSFESFIVGALNPAATNQNISTIDIPVRSAIFITDDVSADFTKSYANALRLMGGDNNEGTIQ